MATLTTVVMKQCILQSELERLRFRLALLESRLADVEIHNERRGRIVRFDGGFSSSAKSAAKQGGVSSGDEAGGRVQEQA